MKSAPDRTWMRPRKYKKLSEKMKVDLEKEIKMMLHASRDCLRNQGVNTKEVSWSVADGYYGEAFGIVRGLAVMGYGFLNGPVNIDEEFNLRYWFDQLCQQVLAEENFHGSHECDHCLERYGCDTAGRIRSWRKA